MESVFFTALAVDQNDSAAETLLVEVFLSEATSSEKMFTIFRELRVPIAAAAARRKIAEGSTTSTCPCGSGYKNHRSLDVAQRR